MESKIKIEKKHFIQQKKDIKDHYLLDKKNIIYESENGYVTRCQDRVTKIIRAVKVIYKYMFTNFEGFCVEIQKLKELDHPNIIRLHEYFDDSKNFYLIMDLCTGGELLDRISEYGNLSEEMAANIFKQMVESVGYCNSLEVYHRNLTPRSFMFLRSEADSPLILVDLGISRLVNDDKKGRSLKQSRGDPYYVSPEQINGEMSPVSNMWSLGVILYLMITGAPPFTGSSAAKIISTVKSMKFYLDLSIWEDISSECKDLICRLLRPKETRLTSAKALHHPWIKMFCKKTIGKATMSSDVIKNLKAFQGAQKLKKAVLTYIATRLSEQELAPLRVMFKQLDENGDGKLSYEEIKRGLKGRTDEKELTELMLAIDTDNNGFIEYNEFLAAAMGEELSYYKERLQQAFSLFDKDHSGKISLKELKRIIKKELGEEDEYWVKMMQQADVNGDGELDFSEFLEIMNSVGNNPA